MIATSTLRLFAVHEAEFYHLDTERFVATIQCESGFMWDEVGDDGASLGVVQIDRKYHPDISPADAYNGYWAIAWMAAEWNRGKPGEWSCYRKLYGR